MKFSDVIIYCRAVGTLKQDTSEQCVHAVGLESKE